MPAGKIPHDRKSSPTSKSHSAKNLDDDSREAIFIINLLKKCSEKQKHHIAYMKNFLVSHEPRFQRVKLHLNYQSKVAIERQPVKNAIREQIEKYSKEMAAQNSNEKMLKIFVKEQQKQEDKVQAIHRKVASYKGQTLHDEKKTVEKSEPDLHEPFEKELHDALQQMPVYKRNDEEMAILPTLEKNDLDDIEWPIGMIEWSEYSKYWDRNVEEAAKCRTLNEKIQTLEENVEKASKDFKAAQAQTKNYKLRDLDYSRRLPLRSSCGHTVCATCMMQFQDRESPFHWKCHQCRSLSDKVLTNWTVMQLIRESDKEDEQESEEDEEESEEDEEESEEDEEESENDNEDRWENDENSEGEV
ncbi:hypothetical protein CAEBREN_00417 [Caenorhabditis brenneri]|uniref:RING-type domain-containing protein n=1 Tax=Caenorhabditis brenneri TaxID=135651 RepID=G0PAM5_CAEBE|nr:hypothetical protein CAEBREN_00417 [Caenorhabditis brenneri]